MVKISHDLTKFYTMHAVLEICNLKNLHNIYQNILDVPDILRAVGWLQANIRSAKCDLQDLRIFASLRTQILRRNVVL